MLWTGECYLACGEMGTILQSADGSEWNEVATPVDWVLRSLAMNGQTVIAVGNGRGASNDAAVLRSTDGGLSWSPGPPLPVASWLYAAYWNGEHFFVGGANGSIHYSSDGLEWESAQTVTSERIYSIVGNPAGTLVAVGSGGVALRSGDDGMSWVLADEGVPEWRGRENRLYTVVWTGHEFVAAVERGVLYENRPQVDPVWNSIHSEGYLGPDFRALATNGETIAIVGQSGAIRLRSCEALLTFERWLSENGLTGTRAATSAVNNPFGPSNALAYAWRLAPYEGDAEWQSPLTVFPGEYSSEVMLREPTQTFSSVGYYFESSVNLVDWEIVARREPFFDWVESFRAEIEESEGFREITFESLASERSQFFRLRVELSQGDKKCLIAFSKKEGSPEWHCIKQISGWTAWL